MAAASAAVQVAAAAQAVAARSWTSSRMALRAGRRVCRWVRAAGGPVLDTSRAAMSECSAISHLAQRKACMPW